MLTRAGALKNQKRPVRAWGPPVFVVPAWGPTPFAEPALVLPPFAVPVFMVRATHASPFSGTSACKPPPRFTV